MAVEKEEYQLVLRISFKALDDPAARKKAKQFLEDSGLSQKAAIKLQKVQKAKPPVGLQL